MPVATQPDPGATTPAALPLPRGQGWAWMAASVAARLLVSVLFVLASLGKIADPTRFLDEIRRYELAPFAVTPAMALVLPWLELLGALFLLIGPLRREARAVLMILLAVFTAAKIVVWAQGKAIECGCGGSFTFLKPIFDNPVGILTNLGLLGLLALDGIAASKRPRRRSSATVAPGSGA